MSRKRKFQLALLISFFISFCGLQEVQAEPLSLDFNDSSCAVEKSDVFSSLPYYSKCTVLPEGYRIIREPTIIVPPGIQTMGGPMGSILVFARTPVSPQTVGPEPGIRLEQEDSPVTGSGKAIGGIEFGDTGNENYFEIDVQREIDSNDKANGVVYFNHMIGDALKTANAAPVIINGVGPRGGGAVENYNMVLDVAGDIAVGGESALRGLKNRIINGDMRIDQRAATVQYGYTTDRWRVVKSSSGTIDFSQDSTAPPGFSKSLKAVVQTADASTTVYDLWYRFEGQDMEDLTFGTTSAKSVTLSFWVKSSVAGNYTAGLQNAASNRTYLQSYTIDSAGTWEYKRITFPGDDMGTWGTGSAQWGKVMFNLGANSDNEGPAGSWKDNSSRQVSGNVDLTATAGATWHLTGVQLETGAVATAYEKRPYGLDFMLAQRYYGEVKAATVNGDVWVSWPQTCKSQPNVASTPGTPNNETVNGALLTHTTPGSATITYDCEF